MNVQAKAHIFLLLTFVTLCSIAHAQQSSPEGDRTRDTVEASEDQQIDARALQRQRLEEDLEKLNSVIGDKPHRLRHGRAVVLFQLGRFDEAIADFDASARTRRPHSEESCWERGLAQYYAEDFAAARDQFSHYHRVGSLDIENGIWHFLSICEVEGIAKAREAMIEYPSNARGEPFPALLNLYAGKGSTEAVLKAAKAGAPSTRALANNLFYAHYYIAKYFEALEDKRRAFTHIEKALANHIPHFMYTCAEIDAERLRARK